MLNKKRTAIIFTANTPHLAHANLMLDSLFDKNKGNFEGDLWVISTGLSERAKNFLDYKGVKYLESTMQSLFSWDKWRRVAEAQPEYAELLKTNNKEVSLRKAFEAFRNKRMSKLILLDWVNKFGQDYDYIALGDNDLYFQRDIHELFEYGYTQAPEQVSYWQEETQILPGTWLWKKDFHYSRFYDVSALDFGTNEINIGFILGKPSVLRDVFTEVKNNFFNLNIDLFMKHSWHDQDLVRLDRAKNPHRYHLLKEGSIVHLCAGGDTVIEERFVKEFYHKKTNEKPYIIHFAGGMWKKYPSIKDTYLVDPECYYFSNEVEAGYDVIRKKSLVNIFNTKNTGFYSERNEKSKVKSRERWLNLADNGKKNILLVGWFEVATHKSLIELLNDFIHFEDYNLAMVNGNVSKRVCDDVIWEDFPDILATLTRVVNDANLAKFFGYHADNIEDWILEDTIRSLQIEYRCTERAARAVANLLYSYFSEVVEFYKPDIILFWCVTNPLGKLMQNICRYKKIPMSGIEWGVLPGTITFDFCGHMGESWVAREKDYFNDLAIEQKDVEIAKKYLSVATSDELSRNKPCEVSQDVLAKVNDLRQHGKKIVLFMESNSAHSGNTYANEQRAKIHSPYFIDDSKAYDRLLEICKKHSDWHILYKPHPISITRGIQSNIDETCTTVVYAGGLNEVLELADLSVTILSQSAYVSMLKGIPVLMLGNIQINGSGAVYTIENVADLEENLSCALEQGITEKQQKAFEEHVARLLKYYVFAFDKRVSTRNIKEMAIKYLDILQGKQEQYYLYERKAYLDMIKPKKYENVEPLVSVVIPIHNSQKYLSECMASICNQTLKNIEIICVNNGSTDNSQKMLEYFAQRDPRIKIIEQDETPNASSPRNNGIQHAKGKYIYLSDSDDYLDSDALNKLVNVAESNDADLVYFFFKQISEQMKTVYPRPRYFTYKRFFPKDKVFKLTEDYYRFFIQYPFPWAKLMRRDFVLENKLFFDLDCRCFEDNPHNLRVLLSAKNPYVCNEQLYNLRIHGESITQSVNPSIIGMLDAVKIMNEIYEEYGKYIEFQKWYVAYKIHLLGWAWSFLPEDLRQEYCEEASKLFSDSDKMWFDNDEIWSTLEMPQDVFVQRVKWILSGNYMEMKEKQKVTKAEDEVKPWEKISKPHLFAIKVCEKLHIINFAIKVKSIFVKK